MRRSLSFLLLNLLANGLFGQQYVVTSQLFADAEAPDVVDLTGVPSYRFQTVYDASDFGDFTGPLTITGLDFRPDASVEGPISYAIENNRVTLSTTSATTTTLAETFQQNLGADEVVVFNGAVTLTSQNLGPLEGPREFDYGFDFQQPFTYDPSLGNLLLDATVTNAEGPLLIDFTFAPGISMTTAQIWTGSLGVDSRVADGPASGAHVIRFTVEPAESPLLVRDDFDDGSITDGNPVLWSPVGQTDITDDGLRIRGTNGQATIVEANQSNSTGWSMRTRVSRESGDLTGIGTISSSENGWVLLNRSGAVQVGTGVDTLASNAIGLDPNENDVILQLDTFDDELRGWAWAANAVPESAEPITLASYNTLPNAAPAMWVRDFDGIDGGQAASTYSWFEFSDQHLPIPVADCNADGNVDAADLACVGAIPARDFVLDSIGSLPGDFDGDGTVDFEDFLTLSANFGQQAGYANGNVDMQGVIDFADFLILSSNFQSAAELTASVPEPSGRCWMLCILLLMLTMSSRRRSPREGNEQVTF